MTQPTPKSQYAYWRLALWTSLGFAVCQLSMQASESNSVLLRTYRESVLPKLESITESTCLGLMINRNTEPQDAD